MTTVHGERQESLLCPRGRLSEDDVHQLLGGPITQRLPLMLYHTTLTKANSELQRQIGVEHLGCKEERKRNISWGWMTDFKWKIPVT